MSVQDIQGVVNTFGHAARRGRQAGFDGVQIFAAHGFFLSQLLCPRYNHRTDAYGGNLQNRARALMEVLEAVRASAGSEYPVLVKLNCQDFVEDGLTLEESLQIGIMLQEGGVDAIELSGGLLNLPNLMKKEIRYEEDEAYFREEAKVFKKAIRVPLILVGGIRSYHLAEQLVESGVADYISMCRPLICEPGLINRWKSGDLRKAVCISCNNCVEQVKQGEGLSCVPLEVQLEENFFPELSETVLASPPHPPGTSYRISIGIEQCASSYLPVIKVQMVYDGKVAEQGLSFPLGTDDHFRVNTAINDLLEKHKSIHDRQ
jgi:2,4-dienoyl-CoA reductase-like NADH-dependent reductase (Old Yellow Enzyme family)